MNRSESIKNIITGYFSGVEVVEEDELLKVNMPAEEVHDLLKLIKNNKGAGAAHLSCLTCVDWNDYLEMVYIISLSETNETIIIKSKIEDTENPVVMSVTDLWKGADPLEREVFDMFGVQFTNHPDLKRIFLDDDWFGFPLRKNYKDEVNVVEL